MQLRPPRAPRIATTTDAPARRDPSVGGGLGGRLARVFRPRGPQTGLSPLVGPPARTILIQNYHPTATAALVRDFQKVGFKVYHPDSDWGRISYYADNTGMGGEAISLADYLSLPPGFVLITCKPHEHDMRAIARQHHDTMVLNVAEHDQVYQVGLGQIMICPDILTYENYPSEMKHKMLYFCRPHLSAEPVKDVSSAFEGKLACCYISLPSIWVEGSAAYEAFRRIYPHECRMYGHQTSHGLLSHEDVNRTMSMAFVTVHFKEKEAYGLSCLESMMLGTPVVGLSRFMADKTLGRFFLTPDNSIVADTVEEAVERLEALSLDEYAAMSRAARERVLELTSDARTVDRLDAAIRESAAA